MTPGGAFSAAASAILAESHFIDEYEADARALKLLCESEDAQAIARALARRTAEEPGELLAYFWRLLGLTAGHPQDAAVRALLGDEPALRDLDDAGVAEVFANARAAVSRAFRQVELRAAGLLAIAIAKRGARGRAA